MSANANSPDPGRSSPLSAWLADLWNWRVWLAIAWLAAFFGFFFSFTLPNSGIERVEIWREAPFLLLENVDPAPAGGDADSSWANLAQRVDLILVAAAILAGAWGLGHLLLRVILPRRSGIEQPGCSAAAGLLARGGQLTAAERTVFAFGLGLSGLALLTLGCGLAGWLSRPLLGGLMAAFVTGELLIRLLSGPAAPKQPGRWSLRYRRGQVVLTYGQMLHGVCLLILVPFVLAMFLGAMLPPIDFDVKAYHLVGPKEWFQQGQVTFLPHNVYTSFPFLTEMLVLLGMVLSDDWFRGALAGQVVLAAFAPLTALAIYAAGTRWFNSTVGILAATIHLTTPWTYRISVIAYAEGGLTFYLFAALLATILAVDRLSPSVRQGGRIVLLAGMLAGSALACKYPGVLQVAIPLGLALCAVPFLRQSPENNRGRSAAIVACLFAAGAALTIGPWLLKNLVQTGNPVYPLLYGVFDGRDLTPELAAKWRAGHRPDHHHVRDLAVKSIDVIAKSDWQSPLLFGLAPLALFAGRRRRMVCWLWAYVGFLFLAWWAFTHRIDRFWIPLIPVVALLAGIGAAWRDNRVWRVACGLALAAAVVFNLAFITTSLVGYNAYLADLDDARAASASTAEGIAFLNRNLPPGSKVLAVGEAQVFDARFPIVYNSVFDESIFEQWFAERQPGVSAGEWPLRDPDEIRRKLRADGITHVYVNWQEILRYRTTYGYTEFVTPERFARLRELGILGAPITHAGRFWDSLSRSDRREVERWAPQLKTRVNGKPALVTFQVFPVRP